MQTFVFFLDQDLHLHINKSLGLISSCIMTNPKGMTELFQGKKFEDILNQTKRLEMASKILGYDEVKLFKIAKFNLSWKAKDQFKKLQPTPTNWNEMRKRMQQKFNDVHLDEIRMKMDTIKQEPQQQV